MCSVNARREICLCVSTNQFLESSRTISPVVNKAWVSKRNRHVWKGHQFNACLVTATINIPPPSSPLPPLPSLRLVLKILYKVIRNIRKFRLETCELGVAVTNDQVRLPRSTQRNDSAVQRRGAHFALP